MVPLGFGRFMHLVVLYGFQGADFDAEQLSLTEQLFDAALGELSCGGCRSGTRYHRRRTTLSRAEWLGSTCSRHHEETHDECVGLLLKQGVFPKHDHHQKLV